MKALVIFSLFVLSFTALLGQTPTPKANPGVALYEQAKFREAVKSLEEASESAEFKSNPEIWNYLGLAYIGNNQIKKSRKAFEKAVALNSASSVYQSNLAYSYLLNHEVKKAYEAADKALALDPRNAVGYQVRGTVNLWTIKLDPAESDAQKFVEVDPTNPEAYLLLSDVLTAKLSVRVSAGSKVKDEVDYLQRAVYALAVGVEKTKGKPRSDEVEKEFEAMSAFYKHYSRDLPKPDAPPTPDPSVTPHRILQKRPARYTDAARAANIEGVIRVAALLGASGKVEHVLVLKYLGYGLDREAIQAAKQIKFEPKKKDGKPVSTVVILEYTFDIY